MDDGGSPATAMSDVQTLIQQDHVIAIVGEYSIVDPTWASYAEQQGVPVIGSILFNPTFGKNPDFFPSGTTFGPLQYTQLLNAKNHGVKKFGYIGVTNTAASTATSAYFNKETSRLGMQLVYTGGISPTGTDFTANCVAAKQAGVEGMYVGATQTADLLLFKNCAQQSFTPLEVGNAYSTSPKWFGVPGTKGTLVSMPVTPMAGQQTPGDQDFTNAMTQYAPDVAAIPVAKIVFAAGQLFAAAAKAGNLGDTPTPAQVITGLYALKGTTLNGLTPPLTFTQGEGHQIYCGYTMGIGDSGYTAPVGLQTTCEDPSELAAVPFG